MDQYKVGPSRPLDRVVGKPVFDKNGVRAGTIRYKLDSNGREKQTLESVWGIEKGSVREDGAIVAKDSAIVTGFIHKEPPDLFPGT